MEMMTKLDHPALAERPSQTFDHSDINSPLRYNYESRTCLYYSNTKKIYSY